MSKHLDINFLSLNRQDGLDQDKLPGVRVTVVPRGAVRARKNDRLAIYLSFENPVNLSSTQIDKLLESLETTYYEQTGTVTSAMKTVTQELNELLLNQNLKNSGRGHQMVAFLYLIVVRGEHLYLSESGPIHGILIKQDDLEHFYDPQAAGRGLGVSRSAGMRFFQSELKAGMVLVMTPFLPKGWKESTLENAFGQSLNTLKRRFLGDAGLEMSGMLLQAKAGNGAFNLIHEEVDAKPTPAIEKPPRTRASLLEIIKKKKESVPSEPSSWEPVTIETPEQPAAKEDYDEPVIHTSPLNPGVETPDSSTVTDEAATTPETSSPSDLPPWLIKGGGWVLKTIRKLVGATQGFLERALPGDEDGVPTSAFAIVAVAVPLVVVAIASVVYLQLGKGQQYDLYFGEAQRAAEIAEFENDRVKERFAWEIVITNLDIAEFYYVTDESSALRVKTQKVLDDMDGIKRLDFQPAMAELGRNVKISRIIATQKDLFLLDEESGSVMRAWLTGTGYEIDSEFRCRPGKYGTLIVQNIIDIANFPQPIQDNSKIFAMDENGVLLICGEDVPPTAVVLTPPDNNWGIPTAIAYENGNIYVLDPLGNAVWIYFETTDEALKNEEIPVFPDSPTFFFVNEVPNMQGAVDIAMNRDDLYILYADSHIVTCTFSTLPEAPTHCNDPALYLDNRPGNESGPYLTGADLTYIFHTPPPEPSLYFLDPYTRSFYHFTLRMNLIQHYQSQADLPAGNASAIAISPTRAVFMAVENQIYQAFFP